MYAYRTPGVRFEWLDPARPAVQPLRTDIAGFVGIAQRGPLHQPRRVESWTQFRSTFGLHIPQGFLAYAVEGFFANGGQTCWVVRVADESAAPAGLDLQDSQGQKAIRLTAANVGTWAHELQISVFRTGPGRFTLALRLPDGTQELWRALATDPTSPRYAVEVLNASATGSRLVRAEDLRPELRQADGSTTRLFADLLSSFGRPAGGADGLASLRPEHVSGSGALGETLPGLAALEAVDEISIVAIPDIMPKPRVVTSYRRKKPRCEDPTGELCAPPFTEVLGEFAPPFDEQQVAELQSQLIAHCERLRDRVAILDVPSFVATPDAVPGWRSAFTSRFAAAYFPWLRVLDPLRLDGLVREVPPSGHVAGIYARGDIAIGVHKPPANEIIEGAADVVRGDAIDDVRHGDLNEIGVNVLRGEAGRGVRVAGARTLSTEPEFRYVNVRRLVTMIEEALDEQLQWSVFEPGDQALWRDLDRVIRTFLLGLWQRGMLDGATAEQAFSVACDESTNPPEETDLGRVTCLVGLQPPWPAEFVVVRIGKTESGTEFVELSGVGRG